MTDRRPTGPRSMGDLLARQRTRDDTLAELVEQTHPTPTDGVTVTSTPEGQAATALARDPDKRRELDEERRRQRDADKPIPRDRGVGKYLPEDRRKRKVED
ncbi:hypothetical protein [Rhodococcus sp. I2R]|uniref:hypothetical protein n=1 Tax=Rhodococcus sp. I2R TaxID=2855445 RepID=UPI001E62D86A|nr:hypothetical protein [Rhodococcus sp. I2R]MCC8927232.1 hypothetical protein [Rhodococcus sp. I2R]